MLKRLLPVVVNFSRLMDERMTRTTTMIFYIAETDEQTINRVHIDRSEEKDGLSI
jgi:hypothetical protein